MAEEKTKILLPISESEEIPLPPGKEESRYNRMQFHMVDLDSDKVHLHYAPSLLQSATMNSLVSVDNSIYLFGNFRQMREFESKCYTKEFDRFNSLLHDKVFFGASRYDWSSDDKSTNVWRTAPNPTMEHFITDCVSLDGKIYVFGFNCFELEVLDLAGGQSKALDLPCELVGCQMSSNPLTDPSNRRFLVHVSNGQLPSPSIYEFRLDDNSSDGNWKCIAVDFLDWTRHGAVVDNVMYFYYSGFPYLIRAFDIATGTWLKIRWKSKFKKVSGMNTEMPFDAMLSLGNRILCFIVWVHLYDKGSTLWVKVHFFKFRVEQSGATVNLYPIRSYSHELPHTCQVMGFLPL